VLLIMAVVTAVSASAFVRLVVAATRGHFRSANAQANPYQHMSLLARSIETGRVEDAGGNPGAQHVHIDDRHVVAAEVVAHDAPRGLGPDAG